ncbi:MAG: membrane protein insertase YidC, partial [Limisphaerales bacterium]
MDRTAVIVVSICIILFGLWFVEQQKYAEQLARQSQPQPRRLQLSTNTIVPAPVQTTIPVQIFATNTPEKLLILTNVNARYIFTSRGGGIKTIELLKYPETISPRWKKEMATNAVATLNTGAPVPVLTILGGASFVGDGNFTLTKIPDGVRAEKSFTNGLVLTKEFHVGSNYLVSASVSLKNNSDKSLALPAQEWVVGTATPMGPYDNGAYEGAMWFDGKKTKDHPVSYFSTNTTVLGFFHRTPTTEYIAGTDNVVWVAAHNQFFALMAMPKKPAQQIIARPVNLPPLIPGEPTPNAPRGVQIALGYPAMTLTTNQPVERQIVFYIGPKEYRTLARIGEKFGNNADQVMQF